MILSKSEYMMFLRHPAWLWLKKHNKKILPKPDANLQAVFDTGNLFEDYAEELFPNAVELGFESYEEYLSLPERTMKALSDGAETIFQGRFESNNITCIVDVLKRVEGNVFDLYEIKSNSSVKKEHFPDLAFQTLVIEGAGLEIRNIYVTHVNSEYRRSGEIEIEKLTKTEDVTNDVRAKTEETKLGIDKAFAVIESSTMPNISPRHVKLGSLSDWMEIYEIIEGEISPYSINNLYKVNKRRIGELEDMGVKMIEDIPDDYDVPNSQIAQVAVTKSGERYFEKENIKEFLESLKYPLYFLDYETTSNVIPPFDGTKPYQQVPFQYSLHILESPDGELTHKEYLHTDNSNPVEPLLKQLKEDVGGVGSVLVWCEGFEKPRNIEMGKMFPEYSGFLSDVNDRVVDLMVPFSKGWFVDKDFYGGASIKDVLPALVPSLSYKDLNVQEGSTASRLWKETFIDEEDTGDRKKIADDLLKYCELDTLAMVEIWKVLKNSQK